MIENISKVLEGKKQQTLHTALLMFLVTTVYANGGALKERGVWMNEKDRQILVLMESKKRTEEKLREIDIKIDKLIKLEKEQVS